MRAWGEARRGLPALLLALAIAGIGMPGAAQGEIFKWIDDKEVAHYTSNRASIPIKYQDTVKLVETRADPGLYRTLDIALPEGPVPGFEEEPLAPEGDAPRRTGGTDVVGDILQGEAAGAPAASAARQAAPRPAIRRTARLGLREYVGKGEAWWQAQFAQANALVSKQQQIVDAHRNQLRKIIKSHSSGNEVLPLEDNPDFQKLSRILPREESRLNQHKRDLRRLDARATELRVPESWRE
ncbi:MAG: hypothetical protein Q8R92_07120 [Deltaproteobacteria bacterium]|nr:hypothetical protein [Deltaproteobacteria bacterium]